MHLMSRLATRFDAVSKPAGGYWIFLPRGAGESVSGAPLQHYTLTRRDNSSWGYSRNGQSGDSGSGGENPEPTYLIKYHDTATGQIKELRTGSGGDPVIEWPAVEPSLDAAKEAAPGSRAVQLKRVLYDVHDASDARFSVADSRMQSHNSRIRDRGGPGLDYQHTESDAR